MKLIDRLDQQVAHHHEMANEGYVHRATDAFNAFSNIAWHNWPELRAAALLLQKVIDTDALDTHPAELHDEIIDALKRLDQ